MNNRGITNSKKSIIAYRRDIDGLRAIAVLCVVLYHIGIGPFTGGFVGVDIFFVISGFLITSTLANDIATGDFSLAAFYERRIRRIVPALLAMLVPVSVLAALVMPPEEFERFGRSLIAAAASVSNVYFDLAGGSGGYFGSDDEAKLLLHTWSLSVEEQFYLMLPVVLALLRRRSRRALVATFAALAAASFALSVVLVATRPTEGFYLAVPRAWELLAGCLLAIAPPTVMARRRTREMLGLVATALIAVAALGFSRTTPFPGAAALLPCLGAVLLIAAGSAGPSLAGSLLAARPCVAVGRLSYSLYLWHWPVIVLVGHATQVLHPGSGELTRNSKLLVLALSFAAAALSFRFVERPFRRRGGASPRRVVTIGLSAGVAAAVLGLLIVAGNGLPRRFDGLAAANLAQAASQPSEACYHYRRIVVDARDFRRCDEDAPRRRNILLLGDSHAGSLARLLRAMEGEGKTGGLGVVSAIVAGCPPSETIKTTRQDRVCNATTRFAFERALDDDVELVILAFSPWWTNGFGLSCASCDDHCQRLLSGAEAETLLLRELDGHVAELLRAGKKLVIQLPIPTYDRSIPTFLAAKAVYARLRPIIERLGLVRPPRRYDYASMTEGLRALAVRHGVAVFDARAALCREQRCDYERGDVSLYMDHAHIAANRIGILEDPLDAVLRSVLTADVAAR